MQSSNRINVDILNLSVFNDSYILKTCNKFVKFSNLTYGNFKPIYNQKYDIKSLVSYIYDLSEVTTLYYTAEDFKLLEAIVKNLVDNTENQRNTNLLKNINIYIKHELTLTNTNELKLPIIQLCIKLIHILIYNCIYLNIEALNIELLQYDSRLSIFVYYIQYTNEIDPSLRMLICEELKNMILNITCDETSNNVIQSHGLYMLAYYIWTNDLDPEISSRIYRIAFDILYDNNYTIAAKSCALYILSHCIENNLDDELCNTLCANAIDILKNDKSTDANKSCAFHVLSFFAYYDLKYDASELIIKMLESNYPCNEQIHIIHILAYYTTYNNNNTLIEYNDLINSLALDILKNDNYIIVDKSCAVHILSHYIENNLDDELCNTLCANAIDILKNDNYIIVDKSCALYVLSCCIKNYRINHDLCKHACQIALDVLCISKYTNIDKLHALYMLAYCIDNNKLDSALIEPAYQMALHILYTNTFNITITTYTLCLISRCNKPIELISDVNNGICQSALVMLRSELSNINKSRALYILSNGVKNNNLDPNLCNNICQMAFDILDKDTFSYDDKVCVLYIISYCIATNKLDPELLKYIYNSALKIISDDECTFVNKEIGIYIISHCIENIEINGTSYYNLFRTAIELLSIEEYIKDSKSRALYVILYCIMNFNMDYNMINELNKYIINILHNKSSSNDIELALNILAYCIATDKIDPVLYQKALDYNEISCGIMADKIDPVLYQKACHEVLNTLYDNKLYKEKENAFNVLSKLTGIDTIDPKLYNVAYCNELKILSDMKSSYEAIECAFNKIANELDPDLCKIACHNELNALRSTKYSSNNEHAFNVLSYYIDNIMIYILYNKITQVLLNVLFNDKSTISNKLCATYILSYYIENDKLHETLYKNIHEEIIQKLCDDNTLDVDKMCALHITACYVKNNHYNDYKYADKICQVAFYVLHEVECTFIDKSCALYIISSYSKQNILNSYLFDHMCISSIEVLCNNKSTIIDIAYALNIILKYNNDKELESNIYDSICLTALKSITSPYIDNPFALYVLSHCIENDKIRSKINLDIYQQASTALNTKPDNYTSNALYILTEYDNTSMKDDKTLMKNVFSNDLFYLYSNTVKEYNKQSINAFRLGTISIHMEVNTNYSILKVIPLSNREKLIQNNNNKLLQYKAHDGLPKISLNKLMFDKIC